MTLVKASIEQNLNELLREILTSRVYEVAKETPLDFAPLLTSRLKNKVWLKREDQQPVFSFKLRGAYNKISRLSEAEQSAASLPQAPEIMRRAWRWPRRNWDCDR